MTPSITTALQLGRVTLGNRLVSAPMERNYCDTEGHMTEQYTEYLLERARAGVALVFTEATYVRADGKGRTHQLGAHDDSCIPPLRRFADRMHAEGALVGCELNHGGRTAQQRVSGHPNVAPSPIPCAIAGGQVPRELGTSEIYQLVEAYAQAAARCVEAGIDVLSIHGGHGYLIHQFLSPLYNRRTDEFADPARFLDLVLSSVRAAAPSVALGLRFSAIEGSEGGLSAEQTYAIISRARLDQLDFLDVSAGSYESGEWIVQSGEWEPGYLRETAARYRRLGLPIGLAGRVNSPEVAERLIARGYTDFVSLARALHADPRFATAALTGADYRPCIACNVCIDNLGQGQVGCSVNPSAGREAVVRPIPTLRVPSDVVVAGAGPAGLTVARELAAAGASVDLVEATTEIGGSMRLAATMRSTPDYHRFLDWSRERLETAGVRLHLSTSLADYLAGRRQPDAVIDARGGRGRTPRVHGAEHERVVDIRAWLSDPATEPPAECTIWGADTVAMVVADTLASRGVKVLLVGAQAEIAPDSGRRAKILAVPRLRANPDVTIVLEATLTAIEPQRIQIVDARGVQRWLDSRGPLLVSQGISRDVEDVDWAAREDVVTPAATIRDAVRGGYDAARRFVERSNQRNRMMSRS